MLTRPYYYVGGSRHCPALIDDMTIDMALGEFQTFQGGGSVHMTVSCKVPGGEHRLLLTHSAHG